MSETFYTGELVKRIREGIGGDFIQGQEGFVHLLAVAFLSRGHVLIEGPPGTAKTLTAKLMAKLLSKTFRRIQFTTDLLPGDILGAHIFSPAKQAFVFIAGPIFSQFIVADEINRTPPRTQSALLEAMEERQVTIEGERHALSPDFFVVATQNSQDYEGTFPLPEVQMDRFLFKLVVTHNPPEVEVAVLRHTMDGKLPPPLETLQPIPFEWERVDREVAAVRVDDSILRYIGEILARTRKHPMLVSGSSLRGGLAIASAARVLALTTGRDFVTADDIKILVPPTLRHRIRLNPEAQVSHLGEDQILSEILAEVPFPE